MCVASPHTRERLRPKVSEDMGAHRCAMLSCCKRAVILAEAASVAARPYCKPTMPADAVTHVYMFCSFAYRPPRVSSPRRVHT